MKNNKEQKVEEIKSMIESLLKQSCEECGERQSITKDIIIECIIWGSINYYEGIGILEESKNEWKEIVTQTIGE